MTESLASGHDGSEGRTLNRSTIFKSIYKRTRELDAWTTTYLKFTKHKTDHIIVQKNKFSQFQTAEAIWAVFAYKASLRLKINF